MLRPQKILFSLLSPIFSHTSTSCVKMKPPEFELIYFLYVLRRWTNNQLGEPKYQVSVAIKLQQTSRRGREREALKRTLQELSTPRYPLIYTSKSASAAKLARPFRGKTDQTPDKTQQSRSEAPLQEEREEKVAVNFFFGLVPLPHFHLKQSVLTRSVLSGTIETAPTGRTPCRLPAQKFRRSQKRRGWEGGSRKKKKINGVFSWCLFKTLYAEDQKNPARSPQTHLTLPTRVREVRWWIYLREGVLIFSPTGQ